MPKNDLFQKAITGDVNAIIQYLETYCPDKWGSAHRQKTEKTGGDTKWQNTNAGKKNQRKKK